MKWITRCSLVLGRLPSPNFNLTFDSQQSYHCAAGFPANMTKTQHLAKGSTDVPITSGKLRLYSMRFCPYAQRVHLVLYAKGIPHDVVYINLKEKPEWYLERYPSGKVPVIVVDGQALYESLIISDFLDAHFPGKKLCPSDPMQWAKDRILIEGFSKVISPWYKFILSPNDPDQALLEPALVELDFFEKELAARGTSCFSGSAPGMVDYMIWPWFERFEMIKPLTGGKVSIPKERYPKLMQWFDLMLKDEAVRKHYCTPEQGAKFMAAHRSGVVDYDSILS